MGPYEKKPAKFYEFSSKVGCVDVAGLAFQLCDHVQKIDGKYFATAFYEGEPKQDGKAESGIYYKKISSADLAFIPADMLKTAQVQYDDMGQTADMLERLSKTIADLNSPEYSRDVA